MKNYTATLDDIYNYIYTNYNNKLYKIKKILSLIDELQNELENLKQR